MVNRILGTIASVAFVTGISGCASQMERPITGFTCCNLRANAGWISSNNVQSGDIISLGTPAMLTSIKRQYYVYGTLGPRDLGLRDDSANSQADTLRWIQRIITVEDPRIKFNAWPQDIRTAVLVARVMVGMDREQVAMALGYPSPNDTPDLAAVTWRYWTSDDLPVDLKFSTEGKLSELVGEPAAVQSLQAPN